MTPKKERTQLGLIRCLEWLAYCLSIGYKQSDLNGLEKIFWTFKDKNGNLKHHAP